MATFGSAELDAFFSALAHDARPDTTTQLRYLKLIDRVSRHLVAMEVRKDNPPSLMLVGQAWPEDEPTPVFLSETDDKRLQGGASSQRMLRSNSFEAWRSSPSFWVRVLHRPNAGNLISMAWTSPVFDLMCM
ncbi:hypothetical protein [Caballeronia sp. GAWG1-1]|uniref:hypothetical protein n=1 Tax=Caballeronia sp. GAWG1-1 TaxID=2921742 RepID=UPI002029942C|nr:hypothetical protein [Caballeronia sp. GAWG1-1]